jgi:hypothetical protein
MSNPEKEFTMTFKCSEAEFLERKMLRLTVRDLYEYGIAACRLMVLGDIGLKRELVALLRPFKTRRVTESDVDIL